MEQISSPPIIISDIMSNTISATNLYTSVYATNIVTAKFMTTFVINNGPLQIVDNKFTNVGTINGVVVQAHGSRHGFNDADPLIVGTINDIKELSSTASYGGISNKIPRVDHVHAHGNLLGGNLHTLVSFGSAGFMSNDDKNKLDGLLPISNPDPVSSSSSAGFSNSFARFDHVHFHGNLTGDSTYHPAATETSNGYMTSTEFQVTDEFSLNASTNIMTLSGIFCALSQPFGTIDGNIGQTIPSSIDTLLTSYWGGTSSLDSISFTNGVYTILYPGYYTILANPIISGNTNGYRSGYLKITTDSGFYISGKTILNYEIISTITPTLWLQSIEYLNIGDTVSVYVSQQTGSSAFMSSLNISQFTICKIL